MNTSRPIILFHVNYVLRRYLSRIPKPANQFCYTNLGKEHFSVSSTGEIFPCQMMNDRPEFSMGNVSSPTFSSQPQFQAVQKHFADMDKQRMQCRNCWAQDLCFMCMAGVEIETKGFRPIPLHRCELMKGVLEEVIRHVARIQDDSAKWEQFCTNLYGGETDD